MRTTFDFTCEATQRLGAVLRDVFLTASDAVVFNPHALGVAAQQALVSEGYAIARVRDAEPEETLELPILDAQAMVRSQWVNPGLEALATQRRAQGGFTLLELMATMTIVAILASIAAPVYQSYVTRSKVAEAFTIAAGAQLAVADYVQANAAWPVDETAAGVSQLEGRGKYTERLVIDGGNIAVAFDTPSDTTLDNTWVVMRPAKDALGHVIWTCGTATAVPTQYTAAALMTLPGQPAGSATPARYLPSTCR